MQNSVVYMTDYVYLYIKKSNNLQLIIHNSQLITNESPSLLQKRTGTGIRPLPLSPGSPQPSGHLDQDEPTTYRSIERNELSGEPAAVHFPTGRADI